MNIKHLRLLFCYEKNFYPIMESITQVLGEEYKERIENILQNIHFIPLEKEILEENIKRWEKENYVNLNYIKGFLKTIDNEQDCPAFTTYLVKEDGSIDYVLLYQYELTDNILIHEIIHAISFSLQQDANGQIKTKNGYEKSLLHHNLEKYDEYMNQLKVNQRRKIIGTRLFNEIFTDYITLLVCRELILKQVTILDKNYIISSYMTFFPYFEELFQQNFDMFVQTYLAKNQNALINELTKKKVEEISECCFQLLVAKENVPLPTRVEMSMYLTNQGYDVTDHTILSTIAENEVYHQIEDKYQNAYCFYIKTLQPIAELYREKDLELKEQKNVKR